MVRSTGFFLCHHANLAIALRLEWLKARARAARWEEEVLLLGEEMRRAIMYCETEAFQWLVRAIDSANRRDLSLEEREGLAAYAFERVARERAMANHWTKKWHAVRARADALKAVLFDGGSKRAPEDVGSDDELPTDEDIITVSMDRAAPVVELEVGGLEDEDLEDD